MNLEILPLAVTMMLGPQILLAILFVTVENPIKLSLSYILGIAVASMVGIAITIFLAKTFDISFNNSLSNSSFGKTVQVILIILLALLSLKSFLGRKEPPKKNWITSLGEITGKKAFTRGFFLILFMPTDILVMLTTGVSIVSNGQTFSAALPLIFLVVFIASLPLLSYLLFQSKAKQLMPKARDWMIENNWAVNIIVYVFFLYLILA